MGPANHTTGIRSVDNDLCSFPIVVDLTEEWPDGIIGNVILDKKRSFCNAYVYGNGGVYICC